MLSPRLNTTAKDSRDMDLSYFSFKLLNAFSNSSISAVGSEMKIFSEFIVRKHGPQNEKAEYSLKKFVDIYLIANVQPSSMDFTISSRVDLVNGSFASCLAS